ncbi:hypothetical protein [Burkholderia ubonensis]|uniref:hypothetical protein n=1 Tax=Burkholderia ubonensis TaxID=101571 RepID=UPI000AF73BF0|nr:hypothetical protein [Burkholderia ubonensis]
MRHPYQMAMTRTQQRTNGNTNGTTSPRARTIERDAAPRVHWAEHEWRAVVAAALREQERDPNLSDYQAADRGQEIALAPARRRRFYSEAGNPQSALREGLAPYFAQMRSELTSNAQEATMTATATADTSSSTESATETAAQAQLELTGDAAPSSSEPPSSTDTLAARVDTPPTDRKTLVRWNDEEKIKIARKALELMRGFDGMKPLEAVRKAVAYELPEDRQRTIATWTDVRWIDEAFKTIQDSEEQAALAREQAEREQRERDEAEQAAAEQQAREEAERAAVLSRDQEIERAVNERMQSLSFETMARMFAGRIAKSIMNEIGAALYADIETQIEGLFEAAKARLEPAAPPTDQSITIKRPTYKPRVLICGLLNQQISEIRQTFGDQIDLSFAKHREEGGSKFGEQCHHKDVILVMADWGGARFKRDAKAAGVPFVPINGTVSALKKWLVGYLSEEAIGAH